MMRSKIILISLVVAICSGCVSHFSAYKLDIRQGNFITPEMRDKLKLGMSRQQVRYVMGTPLLSDTFHGDRWDYIYSLAQHDTVVEKQVLTLYFEGDNLTRIDDSAMPASVPAPAIEQSASAVIAVSAVAAAPIVAAPTVPDAAHVDAEAAIKVSVQGWAAAWSARDSKQYLAAYAPSFHPAGMSRAAWLKQRTERFANAHAIAVSIGDMVVKAQDDTHATATFVQDYRSDTHHDSTRKTVQLEKIAGAWLIVSEQTEK
jgi:outer membrane protein assembly factor BamE